MDRRRPVLRPRSNDLRPHRLRDLKLKPSIFHQAVKATSRRRAAIHHLLFLLVGGSAIRGADLHRMEMRKENPRGGRGGGGISVKGSLTLSTVPLAKFLDLMAALDGGLKGSAGKVTAAFGDSVGDLLPVRGAQVATAEVVPLVTVGLDQG